MRTHVQVARSVSSTVDDTLMHLQETRWVVQMNATMLADLLKLWSTASSEWRYLFLRRLSDADLAQFCKATHIGTAVELVEELRG